MVGYFVLTAKTGERGIAMADERGFEWKLPMNINGNHVKNSHKRSLGNGSLAHSGNTTGATFFLIGQLSPTEHFRSTEPPMSSSSVMLAVATVVSGSIFRIRTRWTQCTFHFVVGAVPRAFPTNPREELQCI